MSLTRTPRRDPGANRTGPIITVSVLVALFVLLGIGIMWLAVQNGLAFAPTPTPSPTTGPTASATPDVRATHIAEDMLTQVAFAATIVGRLTPGASNVLLPDISTGDGALTVQLPLVVVPGATPQPGEPSAPGAIATTSPALVSIGVFMPSVVNPGALTPMPIPTPVAASPLPTPLPLPPTPISPEALLPTPAIPTPMLDFPTPLPLPPTVTPAPVVASELTAFLAASATTRVGPSSTYTATGTLPSGASIRLRGRSPAGDWVYGCCLPNTAQTFWVRRAYVNITGNAPPPGAPAGSDANDPRWLAIQPLDPALIPRPAPTGIPPGDFPLLRYDAQNTGRLPALARSPLQQGWLNAGQAAQSFISPVAVTGSNVLAASADGQFYSLGLDAGNQRWRYNLQGNVQLAPAIQDGLIYLASGARIYALQDQGNVAGLIWQSDLPAPATTPFTAWLDTLFIGAGEGGDARVVAIRRGQPADRREFNDPNGRVQLPAIGQEMLYVGADRVWALDLNLWLGQEILWVSPDVFNVAAPPVYAFPGVARLAELYVADAGGTVHALDANNGTRIWAHPFGGPIAALAVNQNNLFMVNSTTVRAVLRQTGQVQWTQNIAGQVVGGPLVTEDRVLIVTNNGGVTFFDAASGAILDSASAIPATVLGGPAANGSWLFVPGNNTIYGYRGSQ